MLQLIQIFIIDCIKLNNYAKKYLQEAWDINCDTSDRNKNQYKNWEK